MRLIGVPDRVRDARVLDRFHLDLHMEELREGNPELLRPRSARRHDEESGAPDGEHPHANDKGRPTRDSLIPRLFFFHKSKCVFDGNATVVFGFASVRLLRGTIVSRT